MSLHYTLVIQEAEPTKPQIGWFWIRPSAITLFYFIRTKWMPVAASYGITIAYAEGIYWYEAVSQTATPLPVLGKIWRRSDLNQEFVCFGINNWVPI